MKKLIAFLLITAMLFLQVSVCFAREVSTFDVLMNMDPVLLERFRAGGLSDEMIQGFMGVLDEEADKLQKPEDRETLEQYFLSLLLLYVFQQERFLPVMVAFDQEFPEEVIYIAETGRLPRSVKNLPLWRVPIKSPAPRSSKSYSAILKPSAVLHIVFKRCLASSPVASEISTQVDAYCPLPTRPRN